MRVFDDARQQRGHEALEPSLPSSEDAIPQFAEGTRDINIQNTKGLRVATRCATIEQFIATYRAICESSAIFIPNVRRSVGAITQFRFQLADGRPALLGIGTVVEEFTTTANRFGHVGVVVELQQLSPDSTDVFERMLAARASNVGSTEHKTPDDAKIHRVAIPAPITTAAARPGQARAKTELGFATITRKPAAPIKVPPIVMPLAKKPTASIAGPVASAAAVAARKPAERRSADVRSAVDNGAVPRSVDDGWDSIPNSAGTVLEPALDADTIRDVMPFALHHTIGTAEPVTTIAKPISSDLSDGTVVAVEDRSDDGIAVELAGSVRDEEAAKPDVFETVTAVAKLDLFAAATTTTKPNTVAAAERPDVFETVTAVGKSIAAAAEPDVFETVTAVGSPDASLLAMMRASGDAFPTQRSRDPEVPAEIAPAVVDALPSIEEADVASPAVASPVDESERCDVPRCDVPRLSVRAAIPTREAAVLPVVRPSPWRWLAAAAMFVVLFGATTAVIAFVDAPVVAAVPTASPTPARASALNAALMAAVAQDQASEEVGAEPDPEPAATTSTPVKPSSHTMTKPMKRPRPAPVRRYKAPAKCRSLACL